MYRNDGSSYTQYGNTIYDSKGSSYSTAGQLLAVLKSRIKADDTSVTGFNVGVNIGADAGQTIFHCHIHLVSRRRGDVPDPKDGVRGVVPAKLCWEDN
jgi:ATP adenylyltransferase